MCSTTRAELGLKLAVAIAWVPVFGSGNESEKYPFYNQGNESIGIRFTMSLTNKGLLDSITHARTKPPQTSDDCVHGVHVAVCT